MSGVGHNSTAQGSAQLRGYVERIERIESERSDLAKDSRDVLVEAKAAGYDPKIIKRVIRLRKLTAAERSAEQALLTTYCRALDMQMELPLSGEQGDD